MNARLFFLGLVFLISACFLLPDPESDGRVVTVHDGDTVSIHMDGKVQRVRLHGIDSPELHQPFGHTAREWLQHQIQDTTVAVKVLSRDRYGRPVVRLYTGSGTEINRQLVQEGLAHWYPKYAPDRIDLKHAQRTARAAKKGLWQQRSIEPPWAYRARRRPIDTRVSSSR